MAMAILTKAILVEVYWSVGLVKQTYLALQIAVKAVNNIAGPNGLVPTLLVYGAYLRMGKLDPPAPSITDRAAAI